MCLQVIEKYNYEVFRLILLFFLILLAPTEIHPLSNICTHDGLFL